MKISFLKGARSATVDLLLYSWVVAFLFCYVFVSQLTPKLMYFVYRDAWDIAMDFLFILFVWTAVFLACLIVNGLIKERYRFVVFWTAAVLVAANFVVGSKYTKALAPGEGEGGGPMATQLPDWYTKVVSWTNAIPSALTSALVFLLIAGAIFLFYLAAKKFTRPLLVFAAVMCAVLTLNLVYLHNTRFVHDAPDTSLLNYKIKSVAVASGKKLPQTVHIILLDSFPYEAEIFGRDSASAAKYKNISALLSESYVFHNARSAGGSTEETLPKMLTGLNGEISYKSDEAYIKSDEGRTAVSSAPSIFSLAKKSGDSTYATGYFHEYCHLFRSSLDDCSDYSFHGVFADFADDSLRGEMSLRWKVFARRLGNLLGSGSGPFQGDFPLLYDGGGKFMDPKLWASLFKSLVIDYQSFMTKNSGSALFFTHLNIPHIPIVFDSKGEFIGTQEGDNTVSRYQDELLYIDTVLGALMGDIKKTSDYDNSLIIITADHAFRGDEVQGAKYDERHVPLVVKAPKQKERKDMDMEFDTINLMDLLENYYNGRSSGRYDLFSNIQPPAGEPSMGRPPMNEERLMRPPVGDAEREQIMPRPPEPRLESADKPRP